MPKESLYNKTELVVAGISIVGLTMLTLSKLSRPHRKEIRDRDGCCIVTGEMDDLECAHIFHGRDDPAYAVLLSVEMHSLFHWMFRNNSDLIGLCRDENNRSITSTKSRMHSDMSMPELECEYSDQLIGVVTQHCNEYEIFNPFFALFGEVFGD